MKAGSGNNKGRGGRRMWRGETEGVERKKKAGRVRNKIKGG